MFSLAVPVVIAELGWMTMGLVDTLMVGPTRARGDRRRRHRQLAVHGRCIFAMGLLLGLDTLVSQAFGAGRLDDCHTLAGARRGAEPRALGADHAPACSGCQRRSAAGASHPDVLRLTQPYLNVLAWSIPPLLLYAAFRRYLQGMGVVRPVMVALVTANIVNAVVNWMLIFGHSARPRWACAASAWATVGRPCRDGGLSARS